MKYSLLETRRLRYAIKPSTPIQISMNEVTGYAPLAFSYPIPPASYACSLRLSAVADILVMPFLAVKHMGVYTTAMRLRAMQCNRLGCRQISFSLLKRQPVTWVWVWSQDITYKRAMRFQLPSCTGPRHRMPDMVSTVVCSKTSPTIPARDNW